MFLYSKIIILTTLGHLVYWYKRQLLTNFEIEKKDSVTFDRTVKLRISKNAI